MRNFYWGKSSSVAGWSLTLISPLSHGVEEILDTLWVDVRWSLWRDGVTKTKVKTFWNYQLKTKATLSHSHSSLSLSPSLRCLQLHHLNNLISFPGTRRASIRYIPPPVKNNIEYSCVLSSSVKKKKLYNIDNFTWHK